MEQWQIEEICRITKSKYHKWEKKDNYTKHIFTIERIDNKEFWIINNHLQTNNNGWSFPIEWLEPLHDILVLGKGYTNGKK